MKDQQEGPIRMGRISIGVERALHLHLTCGDVGVYLKESEANRFAERYPDRYLAKLEEIQVILKEPDFVKFEEKGDDKYIHFLRFYLKKGQLFPCLVTTKTEGTPKRWWFVKMGAMKLTIEELTGFVRFEKARPAKA
ncbi:MAG: hypothetical protein HUJ60_03605 [Bacilli bacterium]|nr:hypothetical protein [Bacilli bacterium]